MRVSSILMFGDCAGEGLTLQVALRNSCKLVKILSFDCKVRWYVPTENSSKGESGHRVFTAFLVGD